MTLSFGFLIYPFQLGLKQSNMFCESSEVLPLLFSDFMSSDLTAKFFTATASSPFCKVIFWFLASFGGIPWNHSCILRCEWSVSICKCHSRRVLSSRLAGTISSPASNIGFMLDEEFLSTQGQQISYDSFDGHVALPDCGCSLMPFTRCSPSQWLTLASRISVHALFSHALQRKMPAIVTD